MYGSTVAVIKGDASNLDCCSHKGCIGIYKDFRGLGVKLSTSLLQLPGFSEFTCRVLQLANICKVAIKMKPFVLHVLRAFYG